MVNHAGIRGLTTESLPMIFRAIVSSPFSAAPLSASGTFCWTSPVERCQTFGPTVIWTAITYHLNECKVLNRLDRLPSKDWRHDRDSQRECGQPFRPGLASMFLWERQLP
jgi:hypothetical protein